jgi:hypothetical protein
VATIATLNVNLAANTAEFDTKLEKAEKQATNFNRSLEKQIATFGMTSREAKIYGLAQRGVSDETLNAARAMDRQLTVMEQSAKRTNDLKNAAAQLGLVFNPLTLSIAAVTAGIALTSRAFGSFVDGVKSQVKEIDSLNDMAIKLGISYADLAGLAGAAQLSGSDLSGVGKGAAKLEMNLGNGSDKTVEALAKIGLRLNEVKDIPVGQAMAKIADGFSGLSSASDKAAVATALFGKAGQDLIQLLEQGGDTLRTSQERAERYGTALSEIDASAVAAANDAWDVAKAAMEGATATLTVELAPAIQAAGNLTEYFVSNLGTMAEGLEKLFDSALGKLALLSTGLHSVVAILNATTPGFAKGFEDALKVINAYGEMQRRTATTKAKGGDGASLKGDLEEQTWDAADVLDFVGQIDAAKGKAIKEIKSEKMRFRTAEEIAPGLNDSLEKPENRLAGAMLRGSTADYQTRIANRGEGNPAVEALKFQKEAVSEAKKNNQILSDIDRKLPAVGVDVVEIA